METMEAVKTDHDTGQAVEPKAKQGSSAAETAYYQGGGELASPSIINTNSKYLNSPYFREMYAHIGLRRNGPDVPATYIIPMLARGLGESVDFAEYMRLMEEEKAKNPEFAAWLAERRDTAFRAEDLAGSTPGTLAHTIWEFLTRTGYEIELSMKGVPAANDLDYMHKRRANTHDISHLVTGFGPNFAGEAAINWCDVTSYAKYFTPELAHYVGFGQAMLAAGQLNQTYAHYPKASLAVIEASRMGMAAGQALDKPLMMQPWEDYLDWQMDDLVKHLGIVRGPGETAWTWTDEATNG